MRKRFDHVVDLPALVDEIVMDFRGVEVDRPVAQGGQPTSGAAAGTAPGGAFWQFALLDHAGRDHDALPHPATGELDDPAQHR